MKLRTITYEGVTLQYAIMRKTVKNINFRCDETGILRISAPKHVTIVQIEVAILEMWERILQMQQKTLENTAKKIAQKQHHTGDCIQILGQDLRLELHQGAVYRYMMEADILHISVPNIDDYAQIEHVLQQYYKDIAKRILPKMVQDIYPQFASAGIPCPKLSLRRMKSRWGSCTPQTAHMSLNILLVRLPISCIEHVIYHEFCHFFHANHSKAFYSCLEKFCPDWKKQREIARSLVADIL